MLISRFPQPPERSEQFSVLPLMDENANFFILWYVGQLFITINKIPDADYLRRKRICLVHTFGGRRVWWLYWLSSSQDLMVDGNGGCALEQIVPGIVQRRRRSQACFFCKNPLYKNY
jgi:hypothetical protein